MKVSIITLCWNHLEDVTKPFLDEILKTDGVDFELILVDNDSNDGTGRYLKKRFRGNSRVKVIISDRNLGFAGGNNLGVKYATGDYICFLNNDVRVIDKEWLKKMLVYSIENKKTIVGAEEFIDQPLAEWRGNIIPYLGGWCVLAPTRFIKSFGAFHPAFVIPYLEDAELSARARHFGWSCIAIEVGLKHLGSKSIFNQVEIPATREISRAVFSNLMGKLEKLRRWGIRGYLTSDGGKTYFSQILACYVDPTSTPPPRV